MKKIIVLFLLLLLFYNVSAEDGLITDKCSITIDGEEYPKLTDGKYTTYIIAEKKEKLKISCEEEITHLYIYYAKKSTTGIINDKVKIGDNGYLHELIKLNGKDKELNFEYDDEYAIAEINLFNTKTLPDWVEDWQSLDKADLMLFSTHADDEQLFFAGLMPTYVDKGYKIQVVYFTNHYNNPNRYHEQLEGLWTVGVKYYPVISTFPDAYSESLDEAIKNLEKDGYTRENTLKFEVEQIRKYQPSVVVGHDINGEYSHGQHILNTNVLIEAIEKAGDKEYDKESYKLYGTYNIKKLYLHLYDENKIVLDYDKPLKTFDNMTAFEVSKQGFAKHRSQQNTWFTDWLNGENNEYTSVTEIKKYNPAYYGLYYSSVGEDIDKDDMFENISSKKTDTKIIDSTKKVIKNVKKEIKKNNKSSIIGLTMIIISFLGIIILRSRVKHK